MNARTLSRPVRRGAVVLLSVLNTVAWDARAQPAEPAAPSTGGADASALEEDPLELPLLPILDLALLPDTQHFTPRPDHAVFDKTLPGYFRVPTTDIFVKLGVAATTHFMVTSKRLGTPTWFTTSSIPVKGQDFHESPGAQSTATANPSDVSIEFRGKTELGPMRLLFNTSFAQPDPAFGFHPNYAYAQLGGFMAGFTDSTFADVDAYPKTLDFEGPNPLVFFKHAVMRYGHRLNHDKDLRMFLQVAIEQPGADIPTATGAPRDIVPDGVVSWRAEGPWGHVQLAGLVRAVGSQAPDRDSSETVLGIGGNLTGAYHASHKHTFQLGITGGQGIAAYVNDTGGAQYDAAQDESGSLDAIPLLGAYVGLTYAWMPMLASTATYGWLKLWDRDHRAALGASGFQRSQYASLNLVAQPMKGAQFGVEALWGYNRAINGQSGQAFRGQLTFQYRY
ncbi:porin [Myxococcus sp. K15C18031901]|uniref:porin n=1 Tax=Myxococcus dinghuensis TaxID=2906761 RepID=UPI0020A7119D|nr:porin [Myxococcus dinghuensis]MCP3104883.1 porin [Myxococcus dinghuensis]